MCGYKRRKQKAAIDKLIELGFIITFLAGAPAKRYFRITVTPEILNAAVSSGLETGAEVYALTSEAAERSIREKEIAEKNRIATAAEIDEYIRSKMGHSAEEMQFVQNGGTRSYNTETPEFGKKTVCMNGEYQFVQNGGTRMYETDKQARTKGKNKIVQNGVTRVDETAEHTFNQKINNQDISQSVSREQLGAVCTDTADTALTDGRTDGQAHENDDLSFSSAKELLKERIGYAWYVGYFGENDKSGDKTAAGSLTQVDLVLDVILDALCRARERGHISLSKNGMTVTYDELCSHFLKRLERRHLEYFFAKFDPGRKIGNIRAYTLTAVYNAVDEADMVKDHGSRDGASSIDPDKWKELEECFDPWEELAKMTKGEE